VKWTYKPKPLAAAATTVGRLTAGRAAFPSCEQAAVRTPAAMATMKRTGNATRTSADTDSSVGLVRHDRTGELLTSAESMGRKKSLL
jgi:hypothetical protein